MVVALLGFAACDPKPPGSIVAHGSVGQIWVDHVAPGTPMQVVDPNGKVVPTVDQTGSTVNTRTADAKGTLTFRYVPPGVGYRVRAIDRSNGPTSNPVTVTSLVQHPDPAFYRAQDLNVGYGYLTTRDGITLSYMVRLPGPPEDGPYPTVLEYSGYDPANPDAPQPSELIANLLGFATVGINIRGTGCSGGSYQFFEQLQSTDGYDAIETVAAQPWVLGHKVGMVGLSYPGISQLFVGQTRPPSLAAIAPLSVLDDSYRSTLYPGGIFNDGFALSWVRDRVRDYQPGGQPWSQKRIDAGDRQCADNQRSRAQSPDMLGIIERNPFYPVEQQLGDSIAPWTFVDQIDVPVFLAGAWQDEQTGGHFPAMLDRFTGTTKKHFTLTNGNHTESLMPEVIGRWYEFLQFYVAGKVPDGSKLRPIAPIIFQQILGTPSPPTDLDIGPDRFTGMTFAAALAAYEAEPAVRVLFDEGGAPGLAPGLPEPGFEASFPQWPIPTVEPKRWYFAADGRLSSTAPTGVRTGDPPAGVTDRYVSDPSARPRTSFSGGTSEIWRVIPDVDWTPVAPGKSLSYVGDPLAADTVMAGSGSVDLWLRSSEADTDLQVTLSEVRPDGLETYVQNGWLRASRRKLDDARSSVLRPVQTHFERDAAPLPEGTFTPVRVELFPFAHAFRKGSRVRITVQAPGGDRPFWAFATLPGTQINEIGRSISRPSSIVLPVLPDLDVPTPLPACPALRGQPCRQYVQPGPQ